MKKKVKGKGRAVKGKPRTRPYPYEFRLKIVRLYLEEGYSARILHEHFGLSTHTVVRTKLEKRLKAIQEGQRASAA